MKISLGIKNAKFVSIVLRKCLNRTYAFKFPRYGGVGENKRKVIVLRGFLPRGSNPNPVSDKSR